MLRRSVRQFGFALAASVATAMYLWLALGVPLPAPYDKDLSVPFPCMNRSCGCRTADECWSSCCCHTPAERVAWARSRGISPPAPLLTENLKAESATAQCCSSKTPSRCKTSVAAKQTETSPGCYDNSDAPASSDGTVVLLEQLKCHGAGGHWFSVVLALPPAPPQCDDEVCPRAYMVVTAPSRSSPAYPPNVPPPRPEALSS